MATPYDCPQCGQVHPLGCRAHRTRDSMEPCGNPPVTGHNVCRMHGAATPQAKRAALLRNTQAEVVKTLAKMHVEPLDDPIGTFERKVSEHVALSDLTLARARALIDSDDWTVTMASQGEQVRAVIRLAMEWNKQAADLLLNHQRLGLDERKVRIDELSKRATLAKIAVAYKAVRDDKDLGLSAEQKTLLDRLIAEQLG